MPKPRGKQVEPFRPRFYIFCEGEKTEPNYITGYIEQKFPGTMLSPVRKTPKNTPVQLVEVAIEAKGKNPSGDKFWVVFDREAKHKYADALHAEARAKAKANDIRIAISNVCFEVWILLHFQPNVAPYTSYSDLRKRSALKTHIKGYDKGEKRLFSEAEISVARKNAKVMNHQTKAGANPAWNQPHQWNPYTNVYELLDALDKFGKKNIK
ncbi:RloB family protein [Pontiella sulfatireligans]|uniref:RloB domain-containing protein n=1 Tax=Pontiella sulfatireligans TaxID=2750658 RepID=A0A6C2UQU1_9BACT|nr:RloB family protein [Pontiella sulfatireligans]VGO22313.1 hypothetical protein SCARR_04396 [Pontiella sulfatireligans]